MEEYWPPMPRHILPNRSENTHKRGQMTAKGILPSSLQNIIQIRRPLPVHQPPPTPLPEISPSLSPSSCAEPKSCRDDRTDREFDSIEPQTSVETEQLCKIEPERIIGLTLKLSPAAAGTGVNMPEQQPRLQRKTKRHPSATTKMSRRFIGAPFFIRSAVGVKSGKTTKLATLCEIIILKMGWLHGEAGTGSEQYK